jgi:AcrR family transcriptional regulator
MAAVNTSHTPRPTRADVRRRLLDAALVVFAERGFADARLDDVAAAAGLTKGAIYSNFAGKDEVFFAMLDDQVRRRVDVVHAALATDRPGGRTPTTPHDVGRLLTRAFTEGREWQLVFIDFWLRAVRDPVVLEQFLAHRETLRGVIAASVTDIVGATQPEGALTADDVATVVLALCNGLAIEQYIDPRAVPDDLFGRVLAQCALPAAPGLPGA